MIAAVRSMFFFLFCQFKPFISFHIFFMGKMSHTSTTPLTTATDVHSSGNDRQTSAAIIFQWTQRGRWCSDERDGDKWNETKKKRKCARMRERVFVKYWNRNWAFGCFIDTVLVLHIHSRLIDLLVHIQFEHTFFFIVFFFYFCFTRQR